MNMKRRDVLATGLLLAAAQSQAVGAEAIAALRAGGLVLAFRHAIAPGTFDPPGFKLGDCSTQRNLNDEGRVQARRIGQWFGDQQLVPAAVRSSPWCRCIDTARLAFGRAEPWAALGSTRVGSERINAQHLAQLRRAVAASLPGRFDVWVTHMFVLGDLAGLSAESGEGLLLRADASGRVVLAGRLTIA
jgi:hypothetical protein